VPFHDHSIEKTSKDEMMSDSKNTTASSLKKNEFQNVYEHSFTNEVNVPFFWSFCWTLAVLPSAYQNYGLGFWPFIFTLALILPPIIYSFVLSSRYGELLQNTILKRDKRVKKLEKKVSKLADKLALQTGSYPPDTPNILDVDGYKLLNSLDSVLMDLRELDENFDDKPWFDFLSGILEVIRSDDIRIIELTQD
jgi:hypothetical protein